MRQAAGTLTWISSSFGRPLANGMPTFSTDGSNKMPLAEPRTFLAAQPLEPEPVLRPAPAPQTQALVPYENPFLPTSAIPIVGTGIVQDPARRAFADIVSPVAEVTTIANLTFTARPDLAESISQNNLALQIQRRSSLSQAPYIRGFKGNEIYDQVDGQYFFPVRQDLDTIVSKIDPGTVQDVIVINGPYSVQYGPGFTFIDIVTAATPRNQAAQYRSSASWIQNGQQWYGRETVTAGTQNMGFRLSYGHRNGNNYEAGNDIHVPSHYNNGDVLAQLGYNLTSSQRLEFDYRRLDQNHTAYPGQFFDVSALETNAFNVRYIDEDPTKPWTRLLTQGWYNENNMAGNTFDTTKQPQVVTFERALTASIYPQFAELYGANTTNAAVNSALPPVVGFSGSTVGDVSVSGGRIIAQFGELDEVSLTTGVDARVINQRVTEYFTINPFFSNNLDGIDTTTPPFLVPIPPTPAAPPSINPLYPFQFTTGMPRATMVNPGAFAEMTLPWNSYFRTRFGGRGDFVGTSANANSLPFGPSSVTVGDLSRTDALYSVYVVNQLDIIEGLGAAFSFGESQRPPTLIERYAQDMFLGIVQSGYRRVIGNPQLKPEQNFQIDASINAEYENWRGFLRGYNSWVTNYITYDQPFFVGDAPGVGFLSFVNTPLAELRGFEAVGSMDVAPRITPFASAHYVYGMDQTIHQPLTQIPPLQGFAGIRFHDVNAGRRWGLEGFAIITREQNRPGIIRPANLAGEEPQVEERTGGWTTYNLRGYWNLTDNLVVSGGINNITNKAYVEHLSLRSTPITVYSPGFSPYLSTEWTY